MDVEQASQAPASQTPAGWYPHPTMPQTQGYWDGARWTDNVAPMAPRQVAAVAQPEKTNNGVALLGVASAVLIPILGLVIGLTQLNKKGNDGIAIILLSLVSGAFWYVGLTS